MTPQPEDDGTNVFYLWLQNTLTPEIECVK
jgi:hypothetical protein